MQNRRKLIKIIRYMVKIQEILNTQYILSDIRSVD